MASTAKLPICCALIGLAAATLGGCAGAGESLERALARQPLPFHVGIFFDAEGLTSKMPGADDGGIRYLGDEKGILLGLEDTLAVEKPLFSRVKVLESKNRADAVRESQGLDLLLGVGLETLPAFGDPEWPWPWATLEIVSWLFGGIPSWYVPSLRYRTDTSLVVEGLDLHQRKVRQWLAAEDPSQSVPEVDWQETVQSLSQDMSLHDRSSLADNTTDYLVTLLAPPVVVQPGDPLRLSESLTSAINMELTEKLTQILAERVLGEEWSKPVSVAFVAPDPGEVHEADGLALDLAMASQGNVPLQALEVYRLSPEAERFSWKATTADLAFIRKGLEDQPDDYVSFVVPVDIPLEAGMNVLKVRAVREDGEQAVRTMVYFH